MALEICEDKMKVYVGDGLGSFYYLLIRDLTEYGRTIPTRYGRCVEMPEPVTLVYERPGYCWMTIPGRGWNPFLPMAEVFWILNGSGNVDWISYFSKRMRDFQDGTKPEFHGAYGLRIRRWSPDQSKPGQIDQINEVVRKLKKDSFSRQAIISLWDPWNDNLIESKDYPCNNWVGYTLRNRKLDQTVVIRSNDLVWGTPVNAIQFTHLQAYIAGLLGVEMGTLTYVISNLHYYLDLYKPVIAMLINKAFENGEAGPKAIAGFSTFDAMDLNMCSLALEHSLQRKTFPRIDGYLGKLLQALQVYIRIKERESDPALIAGDIAVLDSPLPTLIADFYAKSENDFVKEVLLQV